MKSLPIHGLPKAIQDYIEDVCATFVCPREFVTAAVFFAVSAVVGNRVKVYDGRYTNPLMLWLVNVGRSGSNKTAPVKHVLSYLVRLNSQMHSEYCEAMRLFRLDKKADESARPVCRQLFVSDATDEARNKVMADNPRGVACHMPEIGGFFEDLQRYSKGGSVPRLLRLYDGDAITLNRKLDPEPVFIEHPYMSILGDIQPSLLAETFGDKTFVNSGLTQRFLFCYSENVLCPRFNDREPDYDLQNSWELTLKYLHQIYLGTDTLLRPDLAATAIYAEYYNTLQELKTAADDYDASLLGKCQIQVLRLAGVVHMLNYGCVVGAKTLTITAEEMSYAVSCMDYFRLSARRVRDDIEGSAEASLTKRQVIRALNALYPQANRSLFAQSIGVTPAYISKILA